MKLNGSAKENDLKVASHLAVVVNVLQSAEQRDAGLLGDARAAMGLLAATLLKVSKRVAAREGVEL